ncbi:MAG TPA: hypothetical protein ENL09_04655, partial [Bacteroidetes bacterium]|nr:hypothetical protein [Bacteroidota bacterium]
MSIFLRHTYKQKPQQWGPYDRVQGVLFERANKIGINPEKIALAMPFWNPGDQRDYGIKNILDNKDFTGAEFKQNSLFCPGTEIPDVNKSIINSNWTSQEGCLIFFYIIHNYVWIETTSFFDSNYWASDTGIALSVVSETSTTINISGQCSDGSFSQTEFEYNYGDILKIILNYGDKKFDLKVIGKHTESGVFTNSLSHSSSAPNSFLLRKGHNTNISPATLLYALYFHQTLSDDQIAFLSDNPYYLWQPESPIFYSVPSGTIIIKNITDFCVGVDDISQITNSLQINDTGIGTDLFGNLNADVKVTDVSVAADAISNILNTCLIHDDGFASDVANILVSTLVNDVAVGTDIVTVLSEVLKTVSDS